MGIDRDIGIDPICAWPIAESAVRDTEAIVRVIFRKDVGQSENPEEFRNVSKVAAEPGFEPGLEDSKSPVLPLHNSAIYPIIHSPSVIYIVPKVGLEPTRRLPLNSF